MIEYGLLLLLLLVVVVSHSAAVYHWHRSVRASWSVLCVRYAML